MRADSTALAGRPPWATPRTLRLVTRAYRFMAYLTGVMLIILCFVGVPLRYLAGIPGPAEFVGAIHGVLYIIYLVVAFTMTRIVGMRMLSVGTFLVLLAGILPVLTFVIERWATRTYINPALAAAGPGPREQPVLR